MVHNAAVIGGTGSVGKSLVKSLIGSSNWERVVLIGRRKVDAYDNEPKVTQHVVDMDNIDSEAVEHLKGVDACFITLGVGAPAKSSVEELERIDVIVPTKFATAAKTAGVRHMNILTAVNADVTQKKNGSTNATSSTYCHFKGQVEENIAEKKFESMVGVRPSTLIGSTNTPGIAAVMAKCLRFAIPAKWKDIHVDDVGKAMRKSAEDCLENKGPERTILMGNDLFNTVAAADAADATKGTHGNKQ
eukprot:GFYU01021904.1.p2 GENE.GFYU01021904.1~~GFYU01021904.1.p2  ORF type:complete len:260 (-),score=70.28 GFYU01021904.1:43-780(-)